MMEFQGFTYVVKAKNSLVLVLRSISFSSQFLQLLEGQEWN